MSGTVNPDTDFSITNVLPQRSGIAAPSPAPPAPPATVSTPATTVSPPYIRRKIDVTFKLGTGQFGNSGFNVVTIRGLRCEVVINTAGGGAMGECQMQVWGMTLDQMNQLSTLGMKSSDQSRRNELLVEAGDDVGGMNLVFAGTITDAYFDASSMPAVLFQVTAMQGLYDALKPVPPLSLPGTVDVASAMQSLAQQMGYAFENHGVLAKLRDCYFPGTAREQARALADHSDTTMLIDNNTLVIVPSGGVRGGDVPFISPQTGLIGYPTYNAMGINLTCRYNPAIKLMKLIKVESQLKAACGLWQVYSLSQQLASEMPSGPWFSQIIASNASYAGTSGITTGSAA